MAFAKQNIENKLWHVLLLLVPSANMITSAATASANNIPVLLLPGDVFATRQPDPVLQQIEQTHDLSISTNDAFRAVSVLGQDKSSRTIDDSYDSSDACFNESGRYRAVTICLPQDVQGEAWDFPDYFFQKRVHRIERRLPTKPA